jgi:hypothetical protein
MARARTDLPGDGADRLACEQADDALTGARRPRGSVVPAIIGPFGPPQLACLTSWLRLGLKPRFVHLSQRAALRFAPPRLGGYLHITAESLSDDATAKQVVDWCAGEGVGAAVAGAYATTARLRALFAGTGVAVAPLDASLFSFLDAKSPQLSAARRAGFAVAPWWLIDRAADAAALPGDVFPLVLRPDRPTAHGSAFKVACLDDRTALARFLDAREIPYALIAQRRVDAPNLVIHGARRADGAQARIDAFLVDWKYEGVTQRMRRVELPAALASAASRFVADAGIVGVYHFELLAADRLEDSLFLEINARLGGTTAKALRVGYDEPGWLLWALGVGDAPREPATRARAPVAGVVSLAKRFAAHARGAADPLAWPRLPRGPIGLSAIAGGMIGWRDELGGHDWRLLADYWRELAQ